LGNDSTPLAIKRARRIIGPAGWGRKTRERYQHGAGKAEGGLWIKMWLKAPEFLGEGSQLQPRRCTRDDKPPRYNKKKLSRKRESSEKNMGAPKGGETRTEGAT